MKIYGYHLVNTGLTPTLYAITNQKDLAKRFEKEREMTKFKKTVLEDCSKEDWLFYANKYRSQILRECSIRTRSDFNACGRKTLEILCTCEEEERSVLGEKYVIKRLSQNFNVDSGFFKMSHVKSLSALSYFAMEYNPMMESSTLSFDESGFALDELNIFLELFGETYKE